MVSIQSVLDREFSKYGAVLEGYDVDDFTNVFIDHTDLPLDCFSYTPSDEVLERHTIFNELQKRVFGGMPIQLGYCNGSNTRLDCVEYHKCSEVCIMAHDTILLVGQVCDIHDLKYDTKNMKAFLIPADTIVEMYPSTLHYAPCDAKNGQGFRVAVALIKGTCGAIESIPSNIGEDNLLVSINKWLIAHPDSDEARKNGAYAGLEGNIIDIAEVINK